MSANYTQRLYDVMLELNRPASIHELRERMPIAGGSVRAALDGMLQRGIAIGEGAQQTRRYALRPGTARPADRRGRHKREARA